MADPVYSPPDPQSQGPSGGLRVLRLVRQTSEAQFYQAKYPDGMEVALLVLPPAATAGQAAQRLRLTHAARIRHPNVAAVYEVGSTDDGSFFAVLEQFAGERLSDGVSADRVYGLAEAIDVTLQIAAGLEAAYREGFVHGSLSPSTIVAVPAAGTASRVKLTGFTLRSEADAIEATAPVLAEAIAPYASPERRSGQTPDEPSEVYSLAPSSTISLPASPRVPVGRTMRFRGLPGRCWSVPSPLFRIAASGRSRRWRTRSAGCRLLS
jgi:serine/threonine protein kinase